MTRQEAFIRWNTEMEAWIQYLKKKEELIRLQEEGGTDWGFGKNAPPNSGNI